jgi:isochorismate synthase EntC
VALEFIEDHEGLDRGWYAAPVGWIGGQSGEFAVALRSALVDGNHAVLYAGCGIVAESDPDLEYAESNLKLKAMLSAIAASASASPDHAAATAALEHSS